MEDSLKKRYIIKLLSNIVTGIINVILVAIVPKALGPVTYGQFSFIQQFFNQVIAFLDASTSIAFFTKLSASHTRKDLLSFYFLFAFLLLTVLSIFIVSIDVFGYTNTFLPAIPVKYIYFGMWFGFFTWLTQVFIKISDAHALTVSVELIKILHKIAILFLLLYMVHYTLFDLSSYFYFHYISLLSFLMVITVLFIRKSIFTKQIFKKIKYISLIMEFYRFSSPLFVFNSVAISVSLFDIWLLQKVSGSVQTGYYGLAYSLAAMCFVFTSAMTPVITREFSKSYASKNIEDIQKLFKRYVPMLYAIAAYFGVFISFQSENLIHIFTNESFKGAFFALVIIAFFPIHQTYGQLNGSLFFAMGETKPYSKIGIFVSFSGLVLSYLFIFHYKLGAEGLALKMVLTQVVGVNIQLFFNVKVLKIKMFPFLFHQFYTVVFFVVLAFFASSIPDIMSGYLSNFILKGMVYTILVCIGVFIVPVVFSTNKNELFSIMRKIKNKVNL
ncbi:polysaccharide biosynthesis protein [Sulfurimonas sp. HSL-1716]|uniref:lipopolysaccharide biosynthesis protein n=1 Tax=Hydrocurvibacter sulfurireducens TaxID=3131937 RepID=UPI0031F87FC7